MNVKEGEDMLLNRLQSVFQEHSRDIFKFEPSEIIEIYRVKIMGCVDDDLQEDLQENIGSEDFENFVKTILDLNLHMVLNDPPINLSLMTSA
jgi:hypothetical protein